MFESFIVKNLFNGIIELNVSLSENLLMELSVQFFIDKDFSRCKYVLDSSIVKGIFKQIFIVNNFFIEFYVRKFLIKVFFNVIKKISVKNLSIESTIAKDFFHGIIELIVSSLNNFSMELYG